MSCFSFDIAVYAKCKIDYNLNINVKVVKSVGCRATHNSYSRLGSKQIMVFAKF